MALERTFDQLLQHPQIYEFARQVGAGAFLTVLDLIWDHLAQNVGHAPLAVRQPLNAMERQYNRNALQNHHQRIVIDLTADDSEPEDNREADVDGDDNQTLPYLSDTDDDSPEITLPLSKS